MTDRKDFHHQASLSRARSHTNQLSFSYDPDCFLGDPALDELVSRTASKKYNRIEAGDLDGKTSAELWEEKGCCFASESFRRRSLFVASRRPLRCRVCLVDSSISIRRCRCVVG